MAEANFQRANRGFLSRLLVVSLMLLLPFYILSVDRAFADTYFNSAEPGCNPASPDPAYYFCDDFEDGTWAVTNGGQGSYGDPANDGWGMTFYAVWPDPEGTGYGRCGGKGAAGTNCTATSGQMNRPGFPNQGIMGKHKFAPNNAQVEDFYGRWYYKQLPGYVPGHQKMLMLQNEEGTSWQCCLLMIEFGDNCNIGMDSYADTGWMNQNQGNQVCITPGNWYYMELHVKLNTPGQSNGVMELWMDNCGTNGLGCTGPGTLRTQYTNRVFRTTASQKIGMWWLENWANPMSHGEEYYDQIIAGSKRIGPMGATMNVTPPAAPQNLRVQ